jgi:hypothetical protein
VSVSVQALPSSHIEPLLAFTASEPDSEALSLVLSVLSAMTVNEDVPVEVQIGMEIVSVEVLESCEGVNTTGLGENDAEAPAGNTVVIDRFAENAPELPGPVPRFTVTV